eukprot:COSAG06_NODE_813_length_12161_cov_3.785193_16_plen_59_part_00
MWDRVRKRGLAGVAAALTQRIELRAQAEPPPCCIEVSDDGRLLDPPITCICFLEPSQH